MASRTVKPIDEIRCKEKTSKGNWFRTKSAAKRLASKLGNGVQWYRCPACRLWHVGKPRKKSDIIELPEG